MNGITSATQVFTKIRKLERDLELIKMEVFLSLRKKAERIIILKKSFGILGNKFSAGIIYENDIRKEWNKSLKSLNRK